MRSLFLVVAALGLGLGGCGTGDPARSDAAVSNDLGASDASTLDSNVGLDADVLDASPADATASSDLALLGDGGTCGTSTTEVTVRIGGASTCSDLVGAGDFTADLVSIVADEEHNGVVISLSDCDRGMTCSVCTITVNNVGTEVVPAEYSTTRVVANVTDKSVVLSDPTACSDTTNPCSVGTLFAAADVDLTTSSLDLHGSNVTLGSTSCMADYSVGDNDLTSTRKTLRIAFDYSAEGAATADEGSEASVLVLRHLLRMKNLRSTNTTCRRCTTIDLAEPTQAFVVWHALIGE